MARTISEIKKEMTDVFIKNDTIQTVYGLDPAKDFEAQFSKASVESILFYTVAVAVWTLEMLFDRHKQEITALIGELRPHTRNWYRNKALAFQFGASLTPDADTYDNSGRTDGEVRAQQVVKYAAVVEIAGEVCVKVATGEAGNRHQLSTEECDALNVYFANVKDAGIRLVIINEPADAFGLDVDVYYNPQVFDKNLNRFDGTGQTVHDAISNFVENLNFNGEYRNSALINALSEIEGVVLVELKQATANGDAIDAKYIPVSGYFHISPEKLNINAMPYEFVSDRL